MISNSDKVHLKNITLFLSLHFIIDHLTLFHFLSHTPDNQMDPIDVEPIHLLGWIHLNG